MEPGRVGTSRVEFMPASWGQGLSRVQGERSGMGSGMGEVRGRGKAYACPACVRDRGCGRQVRGNV